VGPGQSSRPEPDRGPPARNRVHPTPDQPVDRPEPSVRIRSSACTYGWPACGWRVRAQPRSPSRKWSETTRIVADFLLVLTTSCEDQVTIALNA